MRIQKLLVIIYIAAIGGAAFQQAKADDNDMQARARALLRQTMATNLPPTNALPMTAPVAPTAPAAPAAPAYSTIPAAPVITNAAPVEPPITGAAMPQVEKSAPIVPVATTPVVTPSVEEQLRATLRKTMAEQDAKKSSTAPVASRPATGHSTTIQTNPTYPVYPTPSYQEAPLVAAPAAPRIVPTPAATTEIGDVATSATNAVDAATEQQLREKMRQRIAELDAQNKTAKKSAPGPASASDYGTMPAPPPAAPALVAGSKEQKLAELLEQYKADQISPSEYHRKRAEIIAGP